MRRLAAAMMLAACACSEGSLQVIPPANLPADIYRASPSPTPTERSVRIFLVNQGRMQPVARRTTGGPSLLEAQLSALLEGPLPEEAAAGLASAIPAGTRLLQATVAGGTATISLSGEFEVGAEPGVLSLRLAQVVYTATEPPGVARVQLLIEGEPVGVVDDTGRLRTGPVDRSNFSSMSPGAAQPPPETQAPGPDGPPEGGAPVQPENVTNP